MQEALNRVDISAQLSERKLSGIDYLYKFNGPYLLLRGGFLAAVHPVYQYFQRHNGLDGESVHWKHRIKPLRLRKPRATPRLVIL